MRFSFDDRFVKQMLESDENFALALNESGIELTTPGQRYAITEDALCEMDKLYEERDEDGRPKGWGRLVADLRDMRWAVEAGVPGEVDGRKLKSWGACYSWAHGRYHMLEDGYDDWIGND